MKAFFGIRRGFTLVELLIVVAIIGVLSTIGIPTFRKMVQKAKKSEAKVALGGLYTAETAFFAEYGVYGTYLDKIGFELSGTGGGTYTIGFPTSACASEALMPKDGSTNLKSVYPTYFDGKDSGIYAAATRTPTACQPSTRIDDGSNFVATATGAISPKADPATLGDLDVWSVNRDRTLANVQDGVN